MNKKNSFGSFGKKNDLQVTDEFKESEEVVPVVTEEIDKDPKQVIDLLIKHVLIDGQNNLRHNDSQKAILLEFPDSSRVINYLE